MKGMIVLILAIGLTGGLALAQYGGTSQDKAAAKPDFDITASYIEACSCDMFCPCYLTRARRIITRAITAGPISFFTPTKAITKTPSSMARKSGWPLISEATGAPARIPGGLSTMTLP